MITLAGTETKSNEEAAELWLEDTGLEINASHPDTDLPYGMGKNYCVVPSWVGVIAVKKEICNLDEAENRSCILSTYPDFYVLHCFILQFVNFLKITIAKI